MAKRFCTACGEALTNEYKFCPGCGVAAKSAEPETVEGQAEKPVRKAKTAARKTKSSARKPEATHSRSGSAFWLMFLIVIGLVFLASIGLQPSGVSGY